jgi:hypothetical protein
MTISTRATEMPTRIDISDAERASPIYSADVSQTFSTNHPPCGAVLDFRVHGGWWNDCARFGAIGRKTPPSLRGLHRPIHRRRAR